MREREIERYIAREGGIQRDRERARERDIERVRDTKIIEKPRQIYR